MYYYQLYTHQKEEEEEGKIIGGERHIIERERAAYV